MSKPKQKAKAKMKWATADVFYGEGEEASSWFQELLEKHKKLRPKMRLIALVARSK